MAQVSVAAPALSVGAPLPSVAGDACGLEPTSPLLAPPAGQCPVTATTNAIGTIIDGMSSVSLEENMANPKEKTPMCLVNELARYNKLQAQYKLVREEGPAHAKLFTVELALGEQTWEAEGSSIKKAQHSAATRALAETALPRPPARPPKHNLGTNPGSITPTVELNGMAMKLGLPVFYRHFDPPPMPGYRPNYNYRGMPHQRYHHPPMPRAFLVELQVGERKFTGEGRTRQAARHNAASNALKDLQSDPLPPKPAPDTQENGNEDEDEENDHDANKSEISQVFEIALKRNLPVNFEVVRESGPPHMKSFVTRLSVGQFSAEEEGKSKKLSKKKAAAIVLAELFKLPPLPVVEKPRPTLFKKKPKSIVKVSPEYSQGMNPISRLAQIQQAKKEREPDYTVVSERSLALRRREFIMQVKVGDDCASGTGPSKKIAKRNAAETLLLQLGYKPSLPAASPDEKCQPQEGEKPVDTRKVTFAEPASPNQKGILHLSADVYQQMEAARNRAGGPPPQQQQQQHQQHQQQQHPAMGYGKKEPSWGGPGSMHPHGLGNTTATIPRELLMKGGSPTAEAMVKVPPVHMAHACQQLDYLAREQGFQVQYMDMQRGKDIMSTLTILPLQIAFHGVGSTVEAARDQAALNTLKQVSEQGLDALASKGKPDNKGLADKMDPKGMDLGGGLVKTPPGPSPEPIGT